MYASAIADQGLIAHARAAHAKLILLAGPEAGMLLVGSGNLSYSGYAGGGECFAAYPWTPEDQTHLAAFQTAKAMADGIAERGMLDSIARSRLTRMWATTDWIHRAALEGPSVVRHNLDEPLGEQFIPAVDGEPVDELVVIAPFYDSYATALRRLRERLRPAHTKVLVQPKRTSVDASRSGVATTISATEIAESVYDAVAHTDRREVRARLATIARTAPAQVQFDDVLVSVDGFAIADQGRAGHHRWRRPCEQRHSSAHVRRVVAA